MKQEIILRETQITDAQRFFEMISSPAFLYFGWEMKTVEEAQEYLLKQAERNLMWKKTEDMFSIIVEEEVVGAVWVIRMAHRYHVGEIGYFVDEKYWKKGIATKAVLLLEKKAFEELSFQRLTIILKPINVPSEKVAIKAWYQKEWLLKSEIRNPDGSLHDGCIYAKLKTEFLKKV